MRPHLVVLLRTLEAGGMQRLVQLLARHLTSRGWRVDLLVRDDRGPARAWLPPQVRRLRLPAGPAFGVRAELTRLLAEAPGRERLVPLWAPLPGLLAAVPAVVGALRRLRPDVVLALGTQANLAALLARRRLDVPVRLVVSEHNVMSRVAELSRNPLRRLYPRLTGALYPEADAVVAVSAAVACDLAAVAGLPPAMTTVLPNPVDLAQVEQGAREPLPKAPPRPFLLGVGRLHWQRGHGLVLAAFARVARRMDVDLVILGEGPERRSLARRARELGVAERVHMPGFDPVPWRWMSRALALVCGAPSEGFGYAAVEALACGCPVVAADAPGALSGLLAGDPCCGLVVPADPDALAEGIARIAATLPPRERLRARARAFDADVLLPRYEALLSNGVPIP